MYVSQIFVILKSVIVRIISTGILAALVSCSGATDVYHVGQHRWVGDSVAFHIYQTSDSTARPSLPDMTVLCRSCNLINPPTALHFDALGNTSAYLPAAVHDISARLHVLGKGIDTTFIQKQRMPEDATKFYALPQPLVGRVLVEQLALLYSDSTQTTILANAQTGDELNIFAEHRMFYLVHHPLYSQPLYLLKSNAVRLF